MRKYAILLAAVLLGLLSGLSYAQALYLSSTCHSCLTLQRRAVRNSFSP